MFLHITMKWTSKIHYEILALIFGAIVVFFCVVYFTQGTQPNVTLISIELGDPKTMVITLFIVIACCIVIWALLSKVDRKVQQTTCTMKLGKWDGTQCNSMLHSSKMKKNAQ